MDKFNKLNEIISDLGWDAYFIKDEKNGTVRGAVIGTGDVITYLVENGESSQNQISVSLEDDEKLDVEKIYHKLLLYHTYYASSQK